MVEGMEIFKYLVRTIDQTDYYWPALRRNIMRARLVWGGLGAPLRQERGGPQGVRNILQGGVTSNINVWFVDLGPFGGNGEEGRRITHIFSQIYHGEASAANNRR